MGNKHKKPKRGKSGSKINQDAQPKEQLLTAPPSTPFKEIENEKKFDMVVPVPTENLAEEHVEPIVSTEISKDEVEKATDEDASGEKTAEITEALVTEEKVEKPEEAADPVVVVVVDDQKQEVIEEIVEEEKAEVIEEEEKQEAVEEDKVEVDRKEEEKSEEQGEKEKLEVQKEKEVEVGTDESAPIVETAEVTSIETAEIAKEAEAIPEETCDDEEEQKEEVVPEVRQTQEVCEQKTSATTAASIAETKVQKEKEVEVTKYEWEKTKDKFFNTEQPIFIQQYKKKFAVILTLIDPEFRYAADIGPCETFDSEGVQKLVQKMKEQGFNKPWPFDEKFKASPNELREFISEVQNHAKFCLKLTCAERGYEYKGARQYKNQSISSVWGAELDPISELKTICAFVKEMESSIVTQLSDGPEKRIWTETQDIFDVILPALEKFDSKTLSQHNITDCYATIHGRMQLGFEISEGEVDQMLEQSFTEDGFGEFPSTVLLAPSVFKTVKQLKLIYAQLDKMSKVTDIRVKHSGIQTITRIFEIISDEEADEVLDELRDHPKVQIDKMFGFNPETFDVQKDEPRKVQYLKMFYTALGVAPADTDAYEFTNSKLIAAFKSFYLVFAAQEINSILFKIFGCQANEGSPVLPEQRLLLTALSDLPKSLKKRLEVGAEYKEGDISEDTDSMYYQVKLIIRGSKNTNLPRNLFQVIFGCYTKSHRLIHAEKVYRFAMKCIEEGNHNVMAVETLRALTRRNVKADNFSKEFFEDLILLALSKYNVPDEKPRKARYDFIDLVFDILRKWKENHVLELDEPKIAEKWANMGHPWFSVSYLSYRFSLLLSCIPVVNYPWSSADVWDGEKDGEKAQLDIKFFIPLARVATAWPDNTDLSAIVDLVSEYVPPDVNRRELYEKMKEYVKTIPIGESWKSSLLDSFSRKISFLTPAKEDQKKKIKLEANQQKKIDNAKDSVEVAKPEASPEVNTKAELVEESEGTLDIANKEEDTEQLLEHVDKVPNNTPVPTEKPENLEEKETSTVKQEDIEAVGVQNEEVKEEGSEESKENQTVNPMQFKLKDLPEGSFMAWYEEDKWNGLPECVRKEVDRQRELNGYSIEK